MKKTRMPKTRKEFEQYLLLAFECGLNAGYSVNHEELQDEEKRVKLEFMEAYGINPKNIER